MTPKTTAAATPTGRLRLLPMLACVAMGCAGPISPPHAPMTEPVAQRVAPSFEKQQWSALSREGHVAVRMREYGDAEGSFHAALQLTEALPRHDARIQTSLGNLVRLAAAYHRSGRERDAERVMALIARTEESRALRGYAQVPYASRYRSLISAPGSRLRDALERAPSRAAQLVGDKHPLDPLIARTARHYDVDPALVKAVVAAESNFDTDAVSRAGAQGLMQLMPDTARQMGVSLPFEAGDNLRGGTRYLREMLDRYGNVAIALAAYNAGPKAVDYYSGIPPYPETEAYVLKVIDLYRGYRGR